MPDKPPATYKAIGATMDTYNDVQEIASHLSIEKGVPVKMATALAYIVNFYKQAHQKDRK